MAGQRNCLSEVEDLFEKLGSWRNESHKQISDIINAHSNSINKGMNDLVKEVDELQAELSVIRKERKVLLETVENLNCEIKHLNDKILVPQPETETLDNPNDKIREEESLKEEIQTDKDSEHELEEKSYKVKRKRK